MITNGSKTGLLLLPYHWLASMITNACAKTIINQQENLREYYSRWKKVELRKGTPSSKSTLDRTRKSNQENNVFSPILQMFNLILIKEKNIIIKWNQTQKWKMHFNFS